MDLYMLFVTISNENVGILNNVWKAQYYYCIGRAQLRTLGDHMNAETMQNKEVSYFVSS